MNRQIGIDEVRAAFKALGFDNPETISEVRFEAGPYGGPNLPTRLGRITVLHATSHVLNNSHLAFWREAVEVVSVSTFEDETDLTEAEIDQMLAEGTPVEVTGPPRVEG